MTATLPLPPSINNMYATVRGRRVLSAEGRHYKTRVALLLRGHKVIEEGDVSIKVDLYRKRRAGDTDNYLKALLDSLTGVIWRDDSQVQEIHALRFEDKRNPRVVVQVEPVTV